MTTETAVVTVNAVTQDVLAMHELSLIGLFFAGEKGRALIRTSRGEIATVTVGDQIGRKTVVAIAPDALILAAPSGAQTVLQMPS